MNQKTTRYTTVAIIIGLSAFIFLSLGRMLGDSPSSHELLVALMIVVFGVVVLFAVVYLVSMYKTHRARKVLARYDAAVLCQPEHQIIETFWAVAVKGDQLYLLDVSKKKPVELLQQPKKDAEISFRKVTFNGFRTFPGIELRVGESIYGLGVMGRSSMFTFMSDAKVEATVQPLLNALRT